MRTVRQHKCILMYAVLATVAMLVVGPGWASAASNQDDQQQYQNQQQYQDQDQGNQSSQTPSRSAQSQGRDMRLEQQIASRLRQQGYGSQGEIMILATGNRVILLGTVPDNRTKDGAEKAAKQIATRQSIDNRLHVNAQARRLPDAELEKDTYDKLGDDLSQTVQVRAQNGTVTLQGQLDNWRQVADAIDAAFAAGATQVNSQFSVAGAGAMAQGGAAGGMYPSYGYTPGQPGQPSYAPRGRQGATGGQQATSGDLRLAQQVADQLRQQLPQRQNVQPIQPQSIYVTVRQGTVILHGYVQNSSQKQQAQQIAQSIQGVQNVQNDIVILRSRGTAGQSESQQGYGGTSTQSRSASSSDRRLAQNVQQQIQNQLPDANINVTARQGTIMLRGTVQDDNQKQEAEQIAQSVSGVQNVQNNLRVSSQGGAFQPQGYIPGQSSQSQQGMASQNQSANQSSSEQSFGAGMAGQNQYSRSGQAGAQQGSGAQDQFSQGARMGGRQGGQIASDMALAQKVVQQLKQQLTGVQNIQIMRPGTIYVMAAQGTVMLHGFVPSTNISQQATQIARAVPGVRNIQSTLRAGAAAGGQAYGYVPGQEQQGAADQGMQGSAQMRQIAESAQTATGQTSQSDMALAQQVAQKLRQQLTGVQNVQVARPGTIYVIVNKGTVTLDGLVSNNNLKQKAEQLAKSVSGVQNVKNSLTIDAAAGGGSQAFGYIPGEQDQFGAQQQQQYGNQQFGNQSTNQSLGYTPPDEDESGMQQYGNEESENQMGNEESAADQFGGNEQPDEGTY